MQGHGGPEDPFTPPEIVDRLEGSQAIAPVVLRVLKTQAHPVRFAVLVGIQHTGSLRSNQLITLMKVYGVGSPRGFEILIDLEGLGLVERGKGRVNLTTFGEVSTDAIVRYRDRLSPAQRIQHYADQIAMNEGDEEVVAIYRDLQSRSPKPLGSLDLPDRIRTVIGTQLEPANIQILRILSRAPDFISRSSKVRGSLAAELGGVVANATYYRYLENLQREGLVEHGSGLLRLTPLGIETGSGFQEYHNTVRNAYWETQRQRVFADLGISPQGPTDQF